jgi:predicted AlkP superfamily pyrophosphatase or phosphodiesterase
VINQQALDAVAAARIHDEHVKPHYDGYGFAQIPPTLLHTLTGAGHAGLPDAAWGGLPRQWDKVIVLLIDAFGWHALQRYVDGYPFLRRFFDQGVVSPLTSQFPSTTTAHITTMATGLPVGQHGLYEWFTYEPIVGRVIVPLLAAEADDKQIPNTLAATTGLTGEQLYPLAPFAERLSANRAGQYTILPYNFLPSMYNEAVNRGSKIVPRVTLSHGLQTMAELVNTVPGPAMFYFYFAEIDALMHRFGPIAPAVDAEVDTLFTALERLLFQPLRGRDDTLLVLTADHGQVRSNPEEYIWLDRVLPQLAPMIRPGPDGIPLAAAGSPRDVFLHIRPDRIGEAFALLHEAMTATGAAEVFTTADLIERGYFGPVGPRFLERVGDVAVLARGDRLLWYGDQRKVPKYVGMHGGLAPAEMETHFSIVPLR